MSEPAAADPGLYARSFADVYDDWYGELDDPAHLVAAISRHCNVGDAVVELGSGTGRLAAPLDQAGFRVIALDISAHMLGQAADGPHRVAADMGELPIKPAAAAAVVIAYNTLFNLTPLSAQQKCFEAAADALRPGGLLTIETFIAPSGSPEEFGLSTRPHPTDVGAELTIVTGPHPTLEGVLVGSHVENGLTSTCRPWQLGYQSPDSLDRCAASANLRLVERWADWSAAPFDAESQRHVSWYQA